jgi:hypothetical protein
MSTVANQLPEWLRRKKDQIADQDASSTTGGHMETEPVVVWEALNLMEAEIVKGRLESEGIPAIIRADAAGTIFGLSVGDLARADVLVPEPLAERALAILSEVVTEPDEEAADEVDNETGSDVTGNLEADEGA